MKVFFETCGEAEENAAQNKSFGAYYSKTKNHKQDVHVHDCCELFLCISGGNSFLIDDKFYDMSDGDLFVINQFEAHKVTPSKDGEFVRYIMHIHPTFLYGFSENDGNLSGCFYATNKPHKVSLNNEEKQRLVSLFESLKDENVYGDSLYKKLRATEIILETNRLFSLHSAPKEEQLTNNTVELIIDYINSNYHRSDLNLNDIAKNAFISVNQLCRVFNKYCSTTVTKYIISKRITEAKKLLAQGKSVTDTAFMCGFNDYANFIKTFKKTVGTSPGKYKINNDTKE